MRRFFTILRIFAPMLIHSALLILTALVAAIVLNELFQPKHWLLWGCINYTLASAFLLWATDYFNPKRRTAAEEH